MTSDVWYTTRWSHTTRKPVPSARWLTPDEARPYFEGREPGGLDIIDAHTVLDGVPSGRWAIGWGTSGPRVRFFNEAGSNWRTVDWDLLDGRLWRWITVDWTYPDDAVRYDATQVVKDVRASVRPDGTGDFEIEDVATGQESFVELTGAAKESYWIDVPEFGDWGALIDPGPSPYEVAGRTEPARAG